jgi:hypothetical protein
MKDSQESGTLKVCFFDAPYSADPIQYDAGVHHVAFTSVFSGLITQYSVGKLTGTLAESWDVNSDFTVWRFKLRSGVKFEDGSEITPEKILNSFKRLAFLMAKRKSHSDIFDNLVEYDPHRPIGKDISGFRLVENNILQMNFTRPVPQLLETISFGIYSILHPNNFDPKTGEFKNDNGIIASGRYRIQHWSGDSFILKRRSDFLPDIFPKNNFERVELVWTKDNLQDSDLIGHYSTMSGLGSAYKFFGPPASGILYLYAVNYDDPVSVFSAPEMRIKFREAFYEEMKNQGHPYVRSFFPLAMSGVTESQVDPNVTKDVAEAGTGRVIRVRLRPSVTTAAPYIPVVLNSVGEKLGLKIELGDTINAIEVNDILDRKVSGIDLVGIVTGVLVKNPKADIRFMFKSKQGVRLPDPTGAIGKMLLQEGFSANDVNQQLFSDNLIWPVNHPSDGIWVRANRVDISQLNTLLPATDFSWIGMKSSGQ